MAGVSPRDGPEAACPRTRVSTHGARVSPHAGAPLLSRAGATRRRHPAPTPFSAGYYVPAPPSAGFYALFDAKTRKFRLAANRSRHIADASADSVRATVHRQPQAYKRSISPS